MKKLLLFSFFTLLSLITTIKGQNYFTALVGTFVDVRPQDFTEVRNLGFVYAQQAEGNLKQVFLGNFTDLEKAEAAIAALQQLGFSNAQVLSGRYADGPEVAIIQLAIRSTRRPIDWDELTRAGELNVQVDNESIKIMTGTFPDVNSAKNTLPKIKALGFDDAFVKMVNSGVLIPVTAVSTGIKEALIPLKLSDNTPITPPPTTTVIPRPMEKEEGIIIPKTSPTVPRPTEQNAAVSDIGVRGIVNPVPRATAPLPTIRGNIKRNSVLDLQRLLQAEGYYDSSLDGYYGNGTLTAYTEMVTEDPEVQKYRLLAPLLLANVGTSKPDQLQAAISELPYDPNAPLVIESNNNATAKAYQAYLLFTSLGPGPQADLLMNAAIKAAYAGVPAGSTSFNYQATYAYKELDQLLLHLFYVHAAPNNPYLLPCWFNDRHATLTAQALQKMGYDAQRLRRESCDAFIQWPEVQLLQAVALDLSPTAQRQTAKLQNAANRRTQLFLTRTALTPTEGSLLETWQQDTWRKINNWAGTDPFLLETTKVLRLAYCQSQVRLEDYFLDQGFKSTEARQLALAALQAIVGVPLERFQ